MKSDHWFSRNRLLSQLRIASGVTLISAAAAMAFVAATDNVLTIGNGSRKARPLPAFGGKLTAQDLAGNGGEPAISESDQDGLDRAAQEAYRHRAYPATEVRIADTLNAQKAWAKIKGKSAKAGVNAQGQWSLAGPSIASYPGSLTFTGHDYIASGRTTALAIAPNCSQAKCRLYLGAAGGGIWRADNGLATSPNWTFVSDSFATNAIGVITLDPSDPTGNTLYVGTGEPNGSGDSNAGLGIYKSIDQLDSGRWEHPLRRVGPGRPRRWGTIWWRILAESQLPACRSLEID